MVSDSQDNHLYDLRKPKQPSLQGNFITSLWEMIVPVDLVSGPERLSMALKYSNTELSHFLWVSFGRLITVGFVKLIF